MSVVYHIDGMETSSQCRIVPANIRHRVEIICDLRYRRGQDGCIL